MFFLDNIGIKDPKTKYNNKKLALRVKCSVLEYIQHLNKVLADLEQVGIIIARVKSQFCQADLKIVGYIYDVEGYYPDTFKDLKLLN